MPRNYIKRIFTAFAILLAVLLSLFLYVIYNPSNLPTKDLASPSQETRDAAAKILRATAKPPSKMKWLFFTLLIRKGESEADILELLKFYNLKPDPGFVVGSLAEFDEYYLDDYWMLECEYDSDNKSLIRWKLASRWRGYDVPWPTNFTGAWITYYANGQKFIEGNFANGKRSGEFVEFNPAGLTNFVCHFDNDKQNRQWTQYFPSGQIQYQVQYSNNVKVGNGIWYNKDGSTNHVSNYSKP
jgi:hypothetical protein